MLNRADSSDIAASSAITEAASQWQLQCWDRASTLEQNLNGRIPRCSSVCELLDEADMRAMTSYHTPRIS